MNTARSCPGLPADWLNGWLAGVGIAALVPGLRLAWTRDPVPVAILHSAQDPVVAIKAGLARLDLAQLPIARELEGCEDISLNISAEEFKQRAVAAASHEFGWTLSSCYSDLRMKSGTQIPDKGPFLTGMPGKANTPADRLGKILGALAPSAVKRTLDGVATRSKQFGFGFDVSRIGSQADDTDQWIDPVIELLAFLGLSIFPARGDGGLTITQRGWKGKRAADRRFCWPVWSQPLDVVAIDALLDAIDERPAPLFSVFGEYETVSYEPTGQNDVTRGYGSRRKPFG